MRAERITTKDVELLHSFFIPPTTLWSLRNNKHQIKGELRLSLAFFGIYMHKLLAINCRKLTLTDLGRRRRHLTHPSPDRSFCMSWVLLCAH